MAAPQPNMLDRRGSTLRQSIRSRRQSAPEVQLVLPPPPPLSFRSQVGPGDRISAARTRAPSMPGSNASYLDDNASARRSKQTGRERAHSRRHSRSNPGPGDLHNQLQARQGRVVSHIQGAVNKLFYPKVEEDATGVIFTGHNMQTKLIDVSMLEDMGKAIQADRDAILQLHRRREALMDTLVGGGGAPGQQHDARPGASQQDAALELARVQPAISKLELELAELVRQRARLVSVAQQGGQEEDHQSFLRKHAADLPSTQKGAEARAAAARGGRRSSYADVQMLAKGLMEAGPGADGGATGRQGQSLNALHKAAAKREARQLERGWRDVLEAVFPEKREKRLQAKGLLTEDMVADGGIKQAERERQESNNHLFVQASTPREHLEFLSVCLDPGRARDFPCAAKVLLLHYTGEGASELDLLAGGRAPQAQVHEVLHLMLLAVREMHAAYLPSLFMALWLFARVPQNRALMLREKLLHHASSRLKSCGARHDQDQALCYSSLILLAGTLWG